ncbi:hypothetical protein HYPSUDRAFT_220324 [Hypholoma sublateritium FD-334 SS-4]|uniref:NACHT domain-containing protein n=1 Tax=Hypholoma sublateritium (strain FD-334 SS-4) TaxID=945553 RepID=A0A0D2NDU4_HYPSF|nr:hypothetical protein HYPSUDRAFT_220324 [Hypholoma sublateritium FD-334 SS-4]
MLHNTHNARFYGGEFTNVGRDLQTTVNNYYTPLQESSNNPAVLKEKALEKLFEHIAPGAFHNSGERHDPPRCHENTRMAILRKVMTWARDPENLRLLMWIYGPAGGGKSAIMQTIAELFQKEGILGGSFFFFRTADKRNIKNYLIATLAYQLTVNLPIFSDYIIPVIHNDPSIFSRTLDAQMKALIIDPMHAAINAHPHVRDLRYIVLVDGLDECAPEDSHREIINLLSNSAFSPFRFIIASRPEFIIRTTFSLHTVVAQTETLALDNMYQPDNDIRLFLRDKFDELRSTHPRGRYFPACWPREEIIATLVRNSSGQFIYAATVIKFLNSPRHDPVKALDFVLKAQPSPERSDTPFAQLDALYHYVLGTVEDIEKVLGILHCIMLIESIDSIDYLEALLGYSEGDSRTILCDMHSLLYVPENNRDEIRFYHTSLGDFLKDPLRACHLYVSPPYSNSFISACFARNMYARGLCSLDTIVGYLSVSCWTYDLGHALLNLDVFAHVPFEMFGFSTGEIYVTLTSYFEWLYIQKLDQTLPQAAQVYDAAVEYLDTWLSCIPSTGTVEDYSPNFLFPIISAIKFGARDWILLNYCVRENFWVSIGIEGAFFLEIENVILDPRRNSFDAIQRMNTTSVLLTFFCRFNVDNRASKHVARWVDTLTILLSSTTHDAVPQRAALFRPYTYCGWMCTCNLYRIACHYATPCKLRDCSYSTGLDCRSCKDASVLVFKNVLHCLSVAAIDYVKRSGIIYETHTYGACRNNLKDGLDHLCVWCRGTAEFLDDKHFGIYLSTFEMFANHL